MPAYKVPTIVRLSAEREIHVPLHPNNTENSAVARALRQSPLDLSRYGEAIAKLDFTGQARRTRGHAPDAPESWIVNASVTIEIAFDHEVMGDDEQDAVTEATAIAREVPDEEMANSVARGIFRVIAEQGWNYDDTSSSVETLPHAVQFVSDNPRFRDDPEDESDEDDIPPSSPAAMRM